MALIAIPAAAAPQGAKVVRGSASVAQNGGVTTITAGHKAILRYDSFNIAPGEAVVFVQPGARAKVLNRINGTSPSKIEGSLRANGIVYLVNPAGVLFANGATVNVGGIFAAAGNLSDQDFLAGRDRFMNLGGRVVNEGTIEGSAVHLIGREVANRGSITAEGGVVTLLAGNEVFVRERDGRIFAKVDGVELGEGSAKPQAAKTAPSLDGTPGVENSGTVDAKRGRVVLGAGDLYSLAVKNTGSVRAAGGSVSVAAKDGAVSNSGTISASDPGGDGGRVAVRGPSVVNSGEISADSGAGRGGSVEVVSDKHTYLTEGSRISATGTTGGGSVVVNSYAGLTIFGTGATIDVSGGEGFVEVSGQDMIFAGTVALDGGVLLLDPRDLIVADTGTSDPLLADRTIDFAEPDALTDITVSDEALEAIDGAIVLRASRDLFVRQRVDLTNDNAVTLEANRDVGIEAPINGARLLNVRADADANATGDVLLSAPLSIDGPALFTGQRILISAGTIETTLAQLYTGDVILLSDTTLTAPGGVRFNNRVNSAGPGPLDPNPAPAALTVDGGVFFNAPVGDTSGGASLASITSFGPVNFYGGPVTTTGTQDYRDQTNIGVDTVLNAPLVHFHDAVDAVIGEEALTVNGNTIFDAPVGGLRVLESVRVTGTTFFNGTLVHTVKNQEYIQAGTLGVDNVLISDTGDIRFRSTLDGPHSLDVLARQGLIQLGDTVGGTAPLERLLLDDGTIILINAPLIDVTGDILLNPDGRGAVPDIATIWAPDGDLLMRSQSGDIFAGVNEKLTNIGNLDMRAAPGGTITVGDLNTLGDMRLTAGAIQLRLRPASSLLNFRGQTEQDQGVDFVAGNGRFFFSVTPTTIGDGPPPRFGSPFGEVNGGDALGTIPFTIIRTITYGVERYTLDDTVLDLQPIPFTDPPEPPPPPEPPGELAEALPGGGPIPFVDRVLRDPLVGPPARAALRAELSLDPRTLRGDELAEALSGREFYNDTRPPEPPEVPPEVSVEGEAPGVEAANHRLRRATALEAVALRREAYGESVEATRAALGDAWDAYAAQSGADVSGAGFRAFLVASENHAATLAALDRLAALLVKLENIGLTRQELAELKLAALEPLTPAGMSVEQLEEAAVGSAVISPKLSVR